MHRWDLQPLKINPVNHNLATHRANWWQALQVMPCSACCVSSLCCVCGGPWALPQCSSWGWGHSQCSLCTGRREMLSVWAPEKTMRWKTWVQNYNELWLYRWSVADFLPWFSRGRLKVNKTGLGVVCTAWMLSLGSNDRCVHGLMQLMAQGPGYQWWSWE